MMHPLGSLASHACVFSDVHLLEPAYDVACPGAALHEREDEQYAHGQVLERVAESSDDTVDGRSRPRACGDEGSQDDRECDEQD